MENINNILPAKRTSMADEKSSNNSYSSSPIRISVPINPPLETIGALCELVTEEVSSNEHSESGDEDSADQVPDGFPLQLEDLIFFEHNYAVGLLHFANKYTQKDPEASIQNKTADATHDLVEVETNVLDCVESLKTSCVSPAGKSECQIKKLSHKIDDNEILSTEDNELVEASEEHLTKEEDIKKGTKCSFSEEKSANCSVDNKKSLSYCSNFKNFSEFKKKHLKVVIVDCKKADDKVNDASSLDITINSAVNSEKGKGKLNVEKEVLSSDNPDTTIKKECQYKTEERNLDDNSLSPLKKPKSRKNYSKSSDGNANKSLDFNKDKISKGNQKILQKAKKLDKSSDSCENEETNTSSLSKREKHSSLSSDCNIFSDETVDTPNVSKTGRRKKSVSFSEDLVSSIKYEDDIEKKQPFAQNKISNQKNVSALNPMSPKSQKKKVVRRESVRSVVNENEPPLFSQPDVMVKVNNDEPACKKEDKDCDNVVDVPFKSHVEENVKEKEDVKSNIASESIVDAEEELHSNSKKPQVEVTTPVVEVKEEVNKFSDESHDEIIPNTNMDKKARLKKEVNQIAVSDTDKDVLNNKTSITNSASEVLLKKAPEEKKNVLNMNELDEAFDKHKLVTESKVVDTNTSDEGKQTPGRKSGRLIKKKEFFGDTSDSDSKKAPSSQNKKLRGSDFDGKKAKHGVLKTKGLPRNTSSDMDVEEDSDSSETEDDPEKLWCICRKPHNSRFMIQCDKCTDWFHGSCVGVTKQLGRQLEKQRKEWTCPKCSVCDEVCVTTLKKPLKRSSDSDNTVAKDSEALEEKCSKLNMQHARNSKRKSESSGNAAESISKKDKSPQQDKKLMHPAIVADTGRKSIKRKFTKSTETSIKEPRSKNLKPDAVQMIPEKKSVSSIPKLDNHNKTQLLQKQSVTTTKNVSSPKKAEVQHNIIKPTTASASKKKICTPTKDKSNVARKKQTCVQCQIETLENSCYCSDACIEKHATQCLKVLRDSKGTLKDSEFESQRIVVFDHSKANVMVNGPTAGKIVSWLKDNPTFTIVCSPSTTPTKKVTTPQKKECDLNYASEKKDATDETTKTTVRLNVRKTLKNILMDRCKKADDIQMNEEDIQKIAVKIEEELHSFLKDIGFKYRAKYRSLMFNIKDPRNQGLFRKILRGGIPPDRLVRMSSEELASIELARWREQENQHLLDMIKRGQLEHQKSGSSLILKKTHKGEVEIEDDLTSIIEQDDSKTVSKEMTEKFVEPEKEVEKDTTHLHRSHLFSLNCKICTGKVLPPPVEEVIPKKVRVAHSISIDLHSPNTSDSVEKNVSRIVGGKSPASSTEEDSMDQEPTSTVTIESPETSLKSTAVDIPYKTATSVWKGFIFMQDVAKFLTSAYKVSGQTDQLRAILPDAIQVCGRIIPDQVWDYLGKIKQSGSKELIIVRYQAANEEEAMAYHSFYLYLSSRKRYGVVSHMSKKIKDFYLLPLASTSPVPMVLVPFDGPGLPSPRPHLLLGVIVTHKFKQTSMAIPQKQPSLSKTKVETAESTSGSFTPPQESRSYTPPLPALPSKPEEVSNSLQSPDNLNLEDTQATPLDNIKTLSDDSTYEGSYTPSDKISVTAKDDDKPYDPEQDVLNLIPDKSEKITSSQSVKERIVPGSDNLEQHKKILDALTREAEETDRQVNALKQLISQPEDEASMQSSSTASIDINSVTETGMSSFLDLPKNLQEILNSVQPILHDGDISEEEDVDMRINTLFGKHSMDEKQNRSLHPIYKAAGLSSGQTLADSEVSYSPLAPTPPPNDDESNASLVACPSDPRIKLRTSFQEQTFSVNDAQSTSEHVTSMQKQLSGECWNSSKEPLPPGIEPAEYHSHQNIISTPPMSDNAASLAYDSTNFVQNSSPHVSSVCPPSFSSFPSSLPPGFSLHTPPPNIKHYPLPPPMVQTSFTPLSLPVHVLPSKEIESDLVKTTWAASNTTPKGDNWQDRQSHWNKSSEHQGVDERHYSSERSSNYHGPHFHKRDSKTRNPEKPHDQGHWDKHSSRPSRYETGRRRNNRFGRQKKN